LLELRFLHLEKRYNDLDSEHREIKQYIGARQLAVKADYKAMDFIFSGCRKKPFCLRSFGNLISFISDPSSDLFTSPLGPEEWIKLSENKKAGINERVRIIQNRFVYLKVYIKDLKRGGDDHAHRASSVEDLKELFRINSLKELLEAVDECDKFLVYNFSVDELSSEYDDN
jgi:hypothetical protein